VLRERSSDPQPKGDLSVLLGDVPAYEPSIARDAVAGLPKLPIENVHPYHVVVFAAQECPTPSGVPRGLGGVMKGVVPKSDLRDRLDAEGLPLKLATQGLEKLEKLADGVLASPQRVVQSPTDERADEERTPALKPPSGLAPGPKGWSAMLEGG
jgi:hypothetical protein